MTERRTKRGTAAVEEPSLIADEPTTEETIDEAATPPTESAADVTGPTAIEAPDSAEPVAAAAELVAAAAEPAAIDAEPAPAEEAEPSPAVAEPEPDTPKGKGRPEAPAPARPPGPRGLRLRYRDEVVPALVRQFEYPNPTMVPRLSKIVVNVGLGEALTNAKAIDAASSDLTTITGQKPIVMKARRSIAQFKIRTGNPIGLKVTLRGQRMWDFLERLVLLTLPRIRDFRGAPGRSFDGRGNYTLGLREQIAFPEIDYDKVDRVRGLEVSIVTTAKSDEESKRLLELLGMPFAS